MNVDAAVVMTMQNITMVSQRVRWLKRLPTVSVIGSVVKWRKKTKGMSDGWLMGNDI